MYIKVTRAEKYEYVNIVRSLFVFKSVKQDDLRDFGYSKDNKYNYGCINNTSTVS